MKNRFKDRRGNVPQTVYAALESVLSSNPGLTGPEATKLVVSTESISGDAEHRFGEFLDNINSKLTAAIETIGGSVAEGSLQSLDREQFAGLQLDAAVEGLMLAGDPMTSLRRKLAADQRPATESFVVVNPGVQFANRDLALSLEAYDETETRKAQLFSAYFNLSITRQSEFTETIWPMIVLPSDQVGLGITVDLMAVFPRAIRNIDAGVTNFHFRNIIRAYKDPAILHKEQTRALPIYRAQAADKFVDTALIPSYNVQLDDVTHPTAPIRLNTEVDLIQLSATDALLAQGTMDHRDALDPTISITAVYIQFGDDILKFAVHQHATSNFVAAPQGNSRQMNLNLKIDSLSIKPGQKNLDGSDLVTLASIDTNELVAHIGIELSGTVNLQQGNMRVYGPGPVLRNLRGADGTELATNTNPGAALKTLIDSAVILGYDVKAYRTNSNQRQDGQRVDTQRYTQLYNVPLLNPVFTEHPISSDPGTSMNDVNTLVATTRIRIENDAVKALQDTFTGLREFTASNNKNMLAPEQFGVGRFYVMPTYRSFDLNVQEVLTTQSSADVMADLREAILNIVRWLTFTIYTESEYKSANDMLSGGMGALPEVVVATDPIIASFLVNFGDLRDLNARFKLRVVESIDERMRGKAYIFFSRFSEDRNTTPHPLNWGNLVWAPETVVTGNLHRDGATSRDTIVNPRYLFINHCPVGAELTITGLEEAVKEAQQRIAMTDITPTP